MVDFFYSHSPTLKKSLERVENLRATLTFSPLPFPYWHKLRWEKIVSQIFSVIRLENEYIDKNKIEWLLSPQEKTTSNQLEKFVGAYYKTYNFYYYHWLGNQNQFNAEHLQQLYNSLGFGHGAENKDEVIQTLNYIQSPSEHPVLQSAISYIAFLKLSPLKLNNHYIASLIHSVCEWRYGYDWKQLLTIEEFFYNDRANYQNVLNEISRQKNITLWIEYYLQSLIKQLEATIENISNIDTNYQRQFNLTTRQIEILSSLEHPNSTITNKDVQKNFHISQITASRELAKLATLGLLLSVGKGRSVRYLKI